MASHTRFLTVPAGRARWQPASFFVRQLLAVNEVPDRPVVDLQATLGQLGDQASQSEVLPPATLEQPVSVLANDLLRPAAAHRLGRQTARLAEPANPVDRRLDADPKAVGRLPARQAFLFNRPHYPLTKVHRIGSSHPMLASCPASILNHFSTPLGIPFRFGVTSSRSRPDSSDLAVVL